jgi:hypothetical protein
MGYCHLFLLNRNSLSHIFNANTLLGESSDQWPRWNTCSRLQYTIFRMPRTPDKSESGFDGPLNLLLWMTLQAWIMYTCWTSTMTYQTNNRTLQIQQQLCWFEVEIWNLSIILSRIHHIGDTKARYMYVHASHIWLQSEPLGGPPMSIRVWEQLSSAPTKKSLQSSQGMVCCILLKAHYQAISDSEYYPSALNLYLTAP